MWARPSGEGSQIGPGGIFLLKSPGGVFVCETHKEDGQPVGSMIFSGILLVMGIGIAAAKVSVGYTPRLTSKDLAGKITSSTFTLEQPRCVFNKFVSATEEIWLVVARSSAAESCAIPRSPEELPYQSFDNNSCYMTLGTAPANYPCPAEGSSELTVLRVGNEVDCKTDPTRPDCNGPLPEPGPYKVKFLAFNSGGPTAESRWSESITLIQGKDPETIDTSPGRRSAGMIAIATILSILCAILLAALIAALVYKYSDVCGSAEIVTVRDPATITRYTTHHIYDQPGRNL
ncbi:uroplakin-3b-like protein 1 [Zootoca vivipara]|uniref:uroplakin-3b-like protein 1 n=1 Tax=Zootoca vivipara TaxID=8524 RepID=UPI00293C0997|nr:uroplakin-3b-like protein 1 [Zootoca vivipara]